MNTIIRIRAYPGQEKFNDLFNRAVAV